MGVSRRLSRSRRRHALTPQAVIGNQQQLRDPVARGDPVLGLTIGVQQQHADLAAVAGVDQPGRVHQGNSVPSCQPRTRQHEAGVTVRDLERNPGADRGSLTWGEQRLLERVEVKSGVARIRPGRQNRPLVQAQDLQLHAGLPLRAKRA